jgi:hypothetical protein
MIEWEENKGMVIKSRKGNGNEIRKRERSIRF